MFVLRGRRLNLLAAILVLAAAGCGGSPPSPPAITPTGPVTVTGKEHLTWNQNASSSAELSTIGFKIYVDGSPTRLTGVVCTPASTGTRGASADVFECKAPLPSMMAGNHSLQLTSFFEKSPTVESAKVGPLLVIVVDATTMAPSSTKLRANREGSSPPATPR